MELHKNFYSLREVAELLGMDKRTCNKLRLAGELKAGKAGKSLSRWMVAREEVERLIAEQSGATT